MTPGATNARFWARIERDPFRLFFPLGALFALLGVAPWTAQVFVHASYPRDLHRLLMINGFLLAFVTGFLMTAITRSTGTRFATKGEITGALVTLLGSGAGAFLPSGELCYLLAALTVAQLGAFALRRFLQKTANPPYTFAFIGVGLALWLASNVGLFLAGAGVPVPEGALAVLNDVYTNGAVMSLVLGVGGRLFPGILGWDEDVAAQRRTYETSASFHLVIPADVWASMALFLASFLLLPFVGARPSLLARGLVALYFGLRFWKIHRLPRTRSYLTWSLWLSCWCNALAYFLPALWAGGGVHALHLGFIGGFSLVTLLISTRVTFAHGAAGTEAEKTTPAIAVFAGLLLLAMATRVTAILWPRLYLDHLGYAAVTWLVGLLVWAWAVLRRGRLAARA
jgi:uncharacterized protein involved in response to NO